MYRSGLRIDPTHPQAPYGRDTQIPAAHNRAVERLPADPALIQYGPSKEFTRL